MKAVHEPIVGRYAHMKIHGSPCRVYYEEAGKGIPLVCTHTAGSDCRQYRHILCNEAITSKYRVIAFDMPWHGKSFPPEDWDGQAEYQLSTELYLRTITDFCDAMELDKPVLVGCSIGGRIVLQVANKCAERFRALIALESADYHDSWYDNACLNQGNIHGGEICAAMVAGMMAPQSPDRYRDETLWMYKQGGPGIFKGDLWFYRIDGDLRGKLTNIDTSKTPLYMMTGEYDFSCPPSDTLRTQKDIPGAKVTIMKEMGHFPICENPKKFFEYFLPVLEEIAAAG